MKLVSLKNSNEYFTTLLLLLVLYVWIKISLMPTLFSWTVWTKIMQSTQSSFICDCYRLAILLFHISTHRQSESSELLFCTFNFRTRLPPDERTRLRVAGQPAHQSEMNTLSRGAYYSCERIAVALVAYPVTGAPKGRKNRAFLSG